MGHLGLSVPRPDLGASPHRRKDASQTTTKPSVAQPAPCGSHVASRVERPMNIGCQHSKYADRHCAEITCDNYYSRCPKHSPSGNREAECSLTTRRKKETVQHG